jgi:hypothetical protein
VRNVLRLNDTIRKTSLEAIFDSRLLRWSLVLAGHAEPGACIEVVAVGMCVNVEGTNLSDASHNTNFSLLDFFTTTTSTTPTWRRTMPNPVAWSRR